MDLIWVPKEISTASNTGALIDKIESSLNELSINYLSLFQ